MDKLSNLISESPFAESPVVPEMLEGSAEIRFQCRKGIGCWNACCSNIDISLTPYDILRLSRRLGISTTEFLQQYTFPYELEPNGIAGVKFKPVENGSACQFMRPEGCDVYTDRPTACRYYPVALLSMRRSDEYTDRNAYALVKEPHCHGHNEPRTLSIEDYRREQGLVEYDEVGRGWRQLVLKKKSSGPTVGKPSKRSLQLFFMACYDLDRFRPFVASEQFGEAYELPDEELQKILLDDKELMLFAFRFLRQVMFGEQTIAMRPDALDKRLARKREREAQSGNRDMPAGEE
ncbi:MAG: 50S rRNA methyltransferase [Candidatus Muproteobacteria bacterium RBG_16_62_13]|uniref:50S rRNA methyltransferase n=1 Tax=Candidatus Muproteobacteria bacterium RBG_16_62_13 TaxID=1817756 RepID=A0A1F6SXA0_9PROT|nr:MAG: 50S rRNA methyltransferase [Candidatus Muproteobacteria bacterium RBG_16_62_13]